MNPIPLLSPAGIPYAYVCGTCQHIPTIGRQMCRLTPEMIAETAEDYLRQAESCCACYTCKAPIPEDNSYEDRCQACREKQEAEDAPRRAEYEAAQVAFDINGLESLARSPDPVAAEALLDLMSNISEDYNCAGWLDGLEFILWEMLQGCPRHFGMGEVTEEELAQLRTLHEKCGGWWIYRHDEKTLASGEVYVSLDEWLQILATRTSTLNSTMTSSQTPSK